MAGLELGAASGQKADKEVPILGKKLTAEEAKARQCIIYDGAAYDVSSYLAKHPGGEAILTSRFGEDVTDDFEALGHSASAREILKTLYVADAIVDEEAGVNKAKSLNKLWSVPLKLTSSRQLNSSNWELTFEWELQEEMVVLAPGRHVKLTAKDASTAEASSRPYTPVDFDKEARTVTFGIKFYEQGEMSQLLRRAVAKADAFTFSMTGPLGEISYNEKEVASGETVYSSSEHLVLIAGGTGITPFLAVLRAKRVASTAVTLVYCANVAGDLMYEKEIRAQLPQEWEVKILCPTSRETLAEQVVEAVSASGAPGRDTACVVCGPPGMEEAVRSALAGKGYAQVLTSTTGALGQKKNKWVNQGGATSNPQVLIDGKRPFHLYPPASEMLPGALWHHLREPIVPLAFAVIFWPVYEALATHFQSQGWGEAAFFTMCFCTMITLTYVVVNGFFMLIEHQRWLERYKIDRQPHQLGSWKLARSAFCEAFIGKLLVAPLGIYFIGTWILWYRGVLQMTFDMALPSVPQIYATFLVASVFNLFFFYCAHRTLHSPYLYGKIHKQHHEWRGTVSFAAENAHPVEQLLANYFPTLGGCLLVGAHPWIFCVWVCERLRNTYEGHSGYAFKGHPVLDFLTITHATEAAEHDFHHTVNAGNFGPQWMDWLWGTMDAWAVAGGEEAYLEAKAAEKLSYMHDS